MDVLLTYAQAAVPVGALLVYSTLILLGVRLVRALKLPQDLPPELHFEPQPPPVRAHATPAEAKLVAARQAQLRTVHARAFSAAQCAQGAQELVVAASAAGAEAALIERLSAAATRAKAAAETADQARAGELASADEATARHLAEAQAAWAEAEAAASVLPQPSSRRLWILIALAGLALAWLVAIIAWRHGLGPESLPR